MNILPLRSIVLSGVILLLAGCSLFSFPENKPLPLTGTLWQPLKVAGTENLQLSKEAEVRLIIRAPGLVNGASGDNYFFGECRLTGNKLRFNPLGVTRRMGPNQIYEQQFLKMLRETEKFRIDKDTLFLFSADGRELASFRGSSRTTETP